VRHFALMDTRAAGDIMRRPRYNARLRSNSITRLTTGVVEAMRSGAIILVIGECGAVKVNQ